MKKNKAGVGDRAVVPTLWTLIPRTPQRACSGVTGDVRFFRRSQLCLLDISYLLEVAHSFTVVLQRAFGWRIFVSLGFSNCCEKSKYRTKISVRKCSVWLQYWRSCVLKLLWSSVSCVYVQTDEISSVGECSVTERISLFTTVCSLSFLYYLHFHPNLPQFLWSFTLVM